MIDDTLDTQLVTQYEAIRQREYELITRLLDLLPKIDALDEERVAQVRDAMFHADHPFLMVMVGPFNAGKSSLINALMGKADLLKIGATPTTDRIRILRYGDEPQRMDSAGEVETVFHPSPLLKKVSFVDTPGLESIFQSHEETTQKFLHRADIVMLAMLATQAMTAKNLESLQMFKQYGKKIIIVINQKDLLTEDEQAEVLEFVKQQSKDKLGLEPPIWMVSAKLGNEARAGSARDNLKWIESGLHQVEQYINTQLSDANRLRQKLQTPLQIVQNVHQSALDVVKANQGTLDQYQSINENIDQQLAAQQREQNKTLRATQETVNQQFDQTIDHSKEAIGETFRFSRALKSMGNGLLEMFRLSRFFRRGDLGYLKSVFQDKGVFEPVRELPTIIDKLAPRLEGQDMQDIDDLVKYGQREIQALPSDLQNKVIGEIQAPIQYDRKNLQATRPQLEDFAEKIQTEELARIEADAKNTLLYLGAWQAIVILLLIALLALASNIEDGGLTAFLFIALVLLSFAGFLFMPIRGRMMHSALANRLNKLRTEYSEILNDAGEKQIDYGMQLRKDTIAPLTRLIEAQTDIHRQQLQQLQETEQEIVAIEGDLNSLGKRKLLGLNL